MAYEREILFSKIQIIAITIILLALLLVASCNLAFAQARYELQCDKTLLNTSTEIAFTQIGVRERTGSNDGEVVKYLASVGLTEGNPYCSAFQYWCFLQACLALNLPVSAIPIKRTGLANGIYASAKQNGLKTTYKAKKHDLLVWKDKHSSKGHIERIVEVGSKGWVTTIGANTSGKNPREGDGVYKQKRNIYHALSRLQVRGIVGFKGM